jgi:hypothetical protein
MQQNQRVMANPNPATVGGFVDCDTTLVFNYTLQPLQTLIALQQPISSEGDFYLCGIQASSIQYQRPDLIQLNALAAFRFSDDLGYKLSDDFIGVGFFSPAFGNSYPYVVRPSHLFKAGTRINIDVQELSNTTNIIQIAFRGRYRYRVSDIQNLAAAQRGLRNA